MKITGNKREYFESLYEDAKTAAAGRNEELRKYEEQYRGSREIDGSAEQATAIRNLTYEIIESQVDVGIPFPKVSPERWSEKTQMNARSVERLCTNLRNKLPFERFNDVDERNTYIFGGSVWLIEWDNSVRTHNSVGEVKITMIDPTDFFPQPNTYRIDDMDYCFMRFSTSKEELRRQYMVSEAVADSAELESDSYVDGNSAEDDDIVTVVVCFYRNENGDVSKFTWSGQAVLEDLDNYYKRKVHICNVCGMRKELCTCENPDYSLVDEEYEELTHDISCNNGKSVIPAFQFVVNDDGTKKIDHYESQVILDEAGNPVTEDVDGFPMPATMEIPVYAMRKTRLPYYVPKTFPIVVRVNTSLSKQLYGQSDCEYLRPQQQDINKIESRIMQKFMRSGVTPLIPEDAEVGASNGVFQNYIRLRNGENRANYGTIDTTPNVQQDFQQAERIYNSAKRTLGITDTFQGFSDASARSGTAKQLQIAQASGRLSSKRVMKQSAYADIDRVIFEYYLAYADEPRPVSFVDEYGQTHGAAFNRYDFIHLDEETGNYYYNDSYLFSTDTSSTFDTNKEYMWQQAFTNYSMGVFGTPNTAVSLLRFWMNLEKHKYPDAHDEVEFWRMQVAKEKEQMEQQQLLAAQQAQAQMQAQTQQQSTQTAETPTMSTK